MISAERADQAIRVITWFQWGLAVLLVPLLIYILIPFLRGDPDSYHNQHKRQVALALAMICFNAGSALGRKKKSWRWGLLLTGWACLGLTFWLAME